jgi:hypothetical protein
MVAQVRLATYEIGAILRRLESDPWDVQVVRVGVARPR